MDQLLLQKLRQRRDELREIVRKKKVSVKKAPAGCFKYTRRKNSFEYYWKAPGAQRYSYIPKENSKLAAEFAQKSYDEKVLKAASKELKLIDKLIKACGKNEIEDAYDKCPEPRKILIKPVKPSDDEFREEWNKQPSCLLGFGENDPEFYHLIARRPLPQFTSSTADRSELRFLRVNREGMNCLRMYLPYL